MKNKEAKEIYKKNAQEVNLFATCLLVLVASWSIRFPGLIFTWDLGGFVWLIGMKILFAILGFLLTAGLFLLAVSLSAFLAAVSFPFVLIHNIRTDYEDAF